MFEYLRLSMNDGSHPIQWEQLGRDGWELVTIYKGVAYFKRVMRTVIISSYEGGQITVSSYPGGK